MKDFNYYAPTEVVFGKESEEQVAHLVKKYGGHKVLVHYGGQSAIKSGLLDKMCNLLSEAGIEYVKLGGVVPNPRLSKIYEGIDLCRKEGVDFILAVGGGSVIDSAKGIAFGVPYEGEKRYAATNGEVICERSVYGSWGATENSTTAQCCGNMGAAIIFNELGKFDGKDLTRIVYNLSEGTDKVRLDPKMTSYTSESYATSIISSGEISLLSRCTSKATGLQVRVLEISDQLTDNAEQARTIKDVCRKHNGHAAPAFAQYILDNGDRRLVLPIYKKILQKPSCVAYSLLHFSQIHRKVPSANHGYRRACQRCARPSLRHGRYTELLRPA